MKLIDFEFDGISAREFGLLPCYFDTSTSELTPVYDINMHPVKAAKSDKFYSTHASYDNPIEFSFDLVSDPCNPEFAFPALDEEMIVNIYRWLTRKRYKKFKPIYDDGSFQNVFCNCTFNLTPLTSGGHVVGFTLKGLTDAPWAYYDEQRVQSNPGENLLVFVDMSDQEGHIYMDCEITVKEAGDFEMINNLEPRRKIVIKNCEAGEVLTFDGKRKQISSSKQHLKLMNDFNYHWPRAVNQWNSRVNIFTANKSFDMSVRYFPVCKGGLLV